MSRDDLAETDQTEPSAQVSALQGLPEHVAVMKIQADQITAMALAHPRSYSQIRAAVMDQVEAFPTFAEKALYSKPVGKETYCQTCRKVLDDWKAKSCGQCGPKGRLVQRPVFASGLSIRAAEGLAEAYGYNEVLSGVEIVNGDMVKVRATFVDYQRGRRWTKEALVSRLQRRRDGSTYRLHDERFQLLQDATLSKVVREVIVRSVPPGLRADLEQEIRKKVKLSDEVLGKILATFAGKGASKVTLEAYLGRPAAEWRQEDRMRLLETLNALEEGEATVAELFGAGEPTDEPIASGGKTGAEATKEKLRAQAAATEQSSTTASTWDHEAQGDPPPPEFELEGEPEPPKPKKGRERKGGH